ncbi:MAG: leucine-rich repeat domain-containing protein [Roseivirga sp.]
MSEAYKKAEKLIAKAKEEGATGLNLMFKKLTEVPELIVDLKGLQTLDLRYNQISDISFLEKLTGLKELYLSRNQISDISFLEKLTDLQTLYLSGNQISDYSFLEKLTGLESLDLSGNQISDISFLEKLTGLQSLDLRDNQISDISPLYRLINKGLDVHLGNRRKGISLGDNPITTPPISIVQEGREAILNYFDQIKDQGEAPLYEAKLMILGQGGAGKTTFASLQADPLCDVKEKRIESTLGIEVYEGVKFRHQSETLNGQKIFTRLWDFGGQNIQKMLHQFFITEDCLYVLVHDKRKESTDFDYWFQIIELLGPRSPVIVLENQSDSKGNNESFALSKYQGLFKNLEIEREEVNLWKTRGMHKARWARLNGVIEEKLSKLEIVNRKVPSKWSKVREFLVEKREEKYIRLDAFLEHCSDQFGLDKEQASLALSYLRALGDVVYFNDRDLRDYIFLDHNWLTEGVYYILADESLEKGKGKFTEQQAFDKWEEHGYSEEAKSMLIKLMLKNQFDLCYEVSKDTFITPLLLPVDRPKSAKPIVANLHFRFQYGFMPHGLFSRAIVRLHEKIDGEKRWKSGVLLIDKETRAKAEVQQFNDPRENQQVIDVKIKGDQRGCKSLLDFIRINIEPLHKEFKNLKVTRKVGCNCTVCLDRMKVGDNPSFYDYQELQSKVENRRYFVDCPNDGYQPVNIGQILSEVVTEDAGEKSIDNELLYRLKEMGMSINKIINNNQANPKFENNPQFYNENKNTNTNTVSVEVKVEIGNLLDEMSLLKQDIGSELIIEGVPEKEVQKLVQDVELAEKALEEVENSGEEPKRPAKTRIKRFFYDLQDEESSLRKGLGKLRKGRDYGVKLAETYNKIAGNMGMPIVPPLALDVIKSI